ncbi:multiple inositol polyphosphate phosphatase 1-like [Ylistrum balloti]|uniref:multiple inositol polyphosphate phosphatase 1-like n=1 Tax=Ylistrum balloti TaxID=509963 RepID=UPI00290581A4|nr:multiple inositol polyphosphate phosphatase 1-like [Ylistrum balloti]
MTGHKLTRVFLLTLAATTVCSLARTSNNFFGRELFGVKTPYLWSRQNMDMSDLTSAQYNGQTCRAVYVDGLYRHGARYPLLESINRMNELRTLLSTGGGINQFVLDWVNAFTDDKQAQLSALGQQEMTVLGERLSSRYQSLLNGQNDKIMFYSSKKDRTRDSVTYFQKGLGDKLGTNISIPVTLDNLMLRFYDTCKLYQNLMNKDETFEEYDKFLHGPEMTKVVSDVNNAVLSGHFNLSVYQVMMIKKICVYELAFFNSSDWCSYLSIPELEVMDYAGDIKSNIIGGYRHKITAQMSCPLFRNILEQMDKVVRGSVDRSVASFRFTHVVPVFSMYTALGLFNGSNTFLATDYLANADRHFRASIILPFSANLVITLYKCGTDYMVKMLVNEEEVDIPACGASMCPYRTVKEHYRQFINCDYDDICENSDTNTGTRTKTAVFVLVFSFVLALL